MANLTNNKDEIIFIYLSAENLSTDCQTLRLKGRKRTFDYPQSKRQLASGVKADTPTFTNLRI